MNGWWIVVIIVILIDLYVFYGVKFLSQNNSDRIKIATYSVYWVISLASMLFILLFPTQPYFEKNPVLRNYLFAIVVALFFGKLIASVFLLTDDIRRGVVWLMSKIFPQSGVDFVPEEGGITRSSFLTWAGVTLGTTLVSALFIGFSNKYNYQLKKIKLAYTNLPKGFKGLKIIHISDIHSGSFTDKAAVTKGIEMIIKAKPDIILFTGDLVNDRADEMDNYTDIFSRLQAPMGVFSTLGNHDYGDYANWKTPEEKTRNLEKLFSIQANMGWRLLMNEHVILEKDNEQIALLGVENWSAFARFPKYGKMDKAYPGTEKIPFKILMSHDPSHWNAEITTKYTDVDLMLAGHTHGMQFGLENPYFKWSPVQWVYKQWAGLYEVGKQKLYVNRGYGFIGYPGRVGILPEVTLIELV